MNTNSHESESQKKKVRISKWYALT